MDIERVFCELCFGFHRALKNAPTSFEQFMRVTFEHLSLDERRKRKTLFEQIIDGPYSDAELDEIWKMSGVDIAIFRPKTIRGFLIVVRDWLAENPSG